MSNHSIGAELKRIKDSVGEIEKRLAAATSDDNNAFSYDLGYDEGWKTAQEAAVDVWADFERGLITLPEVRRRFQTLGEQ